VKERILLAVAAALISGGMSWVTTALTLVGRVTAIEKSIERIEVRLYPATTERTTP
jgi:hypothetical protein